ncbi:MAG TPA: GTP cyclohydrolase I FolE [Nitrospinota bacterium]|nr:GTP cyclohydrolase I FolE [Nitrospinota bacterium]|tara:strand:- start:89517 stop:90059 length:543 start_codon:yes stop_codon:yes gene_type:complete
MKGAIRHLIETIGENPDREGLIKTPERMERSLTFLTSGYHMDPKKIINGAVYTEESSDMVIIRDIDLFSLCEHHMLPFYGKAHIAYIPDGKVIGLSKIPRLLEVFARRLQVQERLTNQIANTIQELIQPKGVAVVIEALHLCMAMRGVEKQNATTITSAMVGGFKLDPRTRQEFLSLIGK